MKTNYFNPSVCNCFVLFFSSLFPWKADDTYLQLKKDLEYLDLKVGGGAGEMVQWLGVLAALAEDQVQFQAPTSGSSLPLF